MLFNSCQFLVFFLMVTALVYAVRQRFRWPVLLLASCYFYMVFVPKYILILFGLIGVDFAAGLAIESAAGARRKAYLVASLAANVGILAFFKYFNFAEGVLSRLGAWVSPGFHLPYLDVLLPIGLSFHTFQSMSYTLEVYRGAQRAERHLGIYALYVLFYPQMVAGPIERPQNLLPQFHAPAPFARENLVRGLELMLWGLFKKMVIADNLALIVDPAYNAPRAHAGWPLIVATYAFAFQIYCDFSGYTDIARGAARAMGYDLMRNFAIPYHAVSVTDFWRRWHISLTTWFRDYVYIPMGGNRVGRLRAAGNVLVVFLISGFWHGASWAFIAWGGLHGLYLLAGRATQAPRQWCWARLGLAEPGPFRTVVAVVITFHLVLVSWVLFRGGTLHHTVDVVRQMWRVGTGGRLLPPSLDRFHRAGLAAAMLFVAAAHLAHRRWGLRELVAGVSRPVYLAMVCLGIASILLLGQFASHDFIYFQF